jgi:hypothetical protein
MALPVLGFVTAPEAMLEPRLRALGLKASWEVKVHRNRTVMLSANGGVLRIHAGYAHAPDRILKAIVRFTRPALRSSDRLEARRELLSFPALSHAPDARPPRRATPSDPMDLPLVALLKERHARLNAEHFGGALSKIPIRLCGRMERKLGHVLLDRANGAPLELAMSRKHVRRGPEAAWMETLLHEMVHQWQAETGRPVDHGAGFRAKAREVGITPRAVSPAR